MTDTQNLSKAERKELKRERKKEEKAERQERWRKEKRNKKLKFWGPAGVILVVVILFIASWVSGGAGLEVTPKEYNFGTVSVRKGTVNTTMSVKNTGKKDLTLRGLETSCMCTSASLTINGIESPRFGMAGHGTNPRDWRATIPPGGEAQLNVYYNPKVHADFRGSVTREITIKTNGLRKTVRIFANQVS